MAQGELARVWQLVLSAPAADMSQKLRTPHESARPASGVIRFTMSLPPCEPLCRPPCAPASPPPGARGSSRPPCDRPRSS